MDEGGANGLPNGKSNSKREDSPETNDIEGAESKDAEIPSPLLPRPKEMTATTALRIAKGI